MVGKDGFDLQPPLRAIPPTRSGVQITPNGVPGATLTLVKRATVTIPKELGSALESYRRDLEFPPSFAAVMQAALREYLDRRGYAPSEVLPAGDRPSMYEDAPTVRGKTASEIVAEDRR